MSACHPSALDWALVEHNLLGWAHFSGELFPVFDLWSTPECSHRDDAVCVPDDGDRGGGADGARDADGARAADDADGADGARENRPQS